MKEDNIIPKKDYLSFNDNEKEKYPIDYLLWKDEGNIGPLWISFKEICYDPFIGEETQVSRNYENSKDLIPGTKEYLAKWFTLSRVKKISKDLGIKLEII